MQIKIENAQNALILGGGPTGLYAALKLLEAVPSSHITVFEKRNKICRPQVINAAFEAINELPEDIKIRLWPDPKKREDIFGDHKKSDAGYWPSAEVKHLTLFQIGEFQKAIKSYIEKFYADRFRYEIREKLELDELKAMIPKYSLVLVTTGNCPLANELREMLSIHDLQVEKLEEIDTLGMNLVYQSAEPEPYERDGELITKATLGGLGITYSHANDASNNVQIYTFSLGVLRETFQAMPKSMKTLAAYPCSKLTFDGKLSDGTELNQEEKLWFARYKEGVMKFMHQFKIPHPSHDQIRLFFAERMEYYFEKAAARFSNVPILYLGDACGATDYKLGLGLGRGLLSTLNITRAIEKHQKFSFDGIVDIHNSYWKDVIDTEFNKRNPKLTGTPEMTYKYCMKGRRVDGNVIDEDSREEFLSEVRKIQQLRLAASKRIEISVPESHAIRFAGA